MSNNGNDVEVRLGADASGLDAGMGKAAKSVSDGAKDMENSLKASADNMKAISESLQARLVGLFSIGAIVGFVRATKDAVTQAESSYRGLEAVANYAGVGIGRAMQEAQKLSADGMLTVSEASKSLQNLLSRGYNLDQAVNTLNRLKDAAAFNRQASLSMGEAVMSATEGLKNENSILVDNAGVTKNVAKMWDEYAKAHGTTAQALTQDQKIQAEYNGVMEETEAQVGNAAKAMGGMQGQQAKLNASWNDMKTSVGEALVPAFAKLAEWGTWIIHNVFEPLLKWVKITAASFAALAVDIGNVWTAVTTMNFSGLGDKIAANRMMLATTRDDILNEKAGSSFVPGQDSGKRKAKTDTAAATTIGKIKDAETADIKSAFEAQKRIYKEAVSAIEKIEKDRITQAEKNRKRLDDIMAPKAVKRDLNAEDENERFWNRAAARTDVSNLMGQSKAALAAGDFKKALELGDRAADMIAELHEAGAEATGQLAAQLKDIAKTQDSAMAGMEKAANEQADKAMETLDKIKKEMAAFQKTKVGVDIEAAEKSILEANKRMQAILDANPLIQKMMVSGQMRDDGGKVMPDKGATLTVPSAAGGWDIPRGMNPLTQLHEREMVLPANIADVVRGAAGGGANNGVTLNLTLPGVGTFETHATPRVAEQLRSALSMESLKYGGRTR